MKRRTFIKTSALVGAGVITSNLSFGKSAQQSVQAGKRIGIIGLDTSHVEAFSNAFNAENASPDLLGYKVVAAFPYASKDIESSIGRLALFTEAVKKVGVEIVDTIPELLKKVDVVLLETVDGRPHLEQAIPVFKAGKTMFIDKPLGGTLTDAFAIVQAAKDFKQPVFSTSSLRYMSNFDDIVNKKSVGDILGAESYGPSSFEPTHPDFFWYGIHAIEALYTVMGTGCHTVSRVHTPDTDVVCGIWDGNRIGTFRGLRTGSQGYGGNVFGKNGISPFGKSMGYTPMLVEIAKYFQSGISPVSSDITLELFTFMEAADESKRRGGLSVSMAETRQKALAQMKRTW